ncbi:MAG: type I-U CRISPR-associated protein Csb2 [Acidobacteria bacterium]|nr:type I-U CRISPR-associated protein Csb2 [Acidobacteriota bacterium]
MTFAVTVELLHNTFRADPEGAANTGQASRGEWPPAPSRLFAAFVAADGTGERRRVTDGTELSWLESLSPPEIQASAGSSVLGQRLEDRYVVEHKPRGAPEDNTVQEYPARKSALVRPGFRVSPRNPKVVYRWDEEAPEAVLDGLRRRAARIGYLGTADSPVRVRAMALEPESTGVQGSYVPDPEGEVVITVAAPGDLDLLDRMYEAWVEHGPVIGRGQFPALRHEVTYRSPGAPAPGENGTVVAWLRLRPAVSGRRVSVITALFKKAVLSAYQDLFGEPPPVLHGHGLGRSGYDLARFLALPDVGYRWSRGRIHGLALWLPPASAPVESARARDAAWSLRRLAGQGINVSVVRWDSLDRLVAANPKRWRRGSAGWATAFPAVHERRGPVGLEEVARWCRHAGLPSPVAVRLARTPFVPGAVDLAPVEVNRPGRPKLPYSHVEICFAEPVRGPVVIGAGRQRGLGLCVQVDGAADE